MSGNTNDEVEISLLRAGKQLLARADQAWTSISGRVCSQFDEDMLDEGRARYWGERGGVVVCGDATEGDGGDLQDGPNASLGTEESDYRFWATASPWRLRLERLRQYSSTEGEDPIRSSVVINENRWRSTYGDKVKSGTMLPDVSMKATEGHSTPGQENLDLLLRPTAFMRAFNFSRASESIVGGRLGIRMQASPVQTDEFVLGVSGIIALGTDEYAMTVDALSGILLEVEIFIDGRPARRHALSEILIDCQLDFSLFVSA